MNIKWLAAITAPLFGYWYSRRYQEDKEPTRTTEPDILIARELSIGPGLCHGEVVGTAYSNIGIVGQFVTRRDDERRFAKALARARMECGRYSLRNIAHDDPGHDSIHGQDEQRILSFHRTPLHSHKEGAPQAVTCFLNRVREKLPSHDSKAKHFTVAEAENLLKEGQQKYCRGR